jgi:hypothetical protein
MPRLAQGIRPGQAVNRQLTEPLKVDRAPIRVTPGLGHPHSQFYQQFFVDNGKGVTKPPSLPAIPLEGRYPTDRSILTA